MPASTITQQYLEDPRITMWRWLMCGGSLQLVELVHMKETGEPCNLKIKRPIVGLGNAKDKRDG